MSGELTITGGYLCEVQADCNCAGGGPEVGGAHELHCGLEPIMPVAELDAILTGRGRLLNLIDPIVEAGKGQIGTHSDRCFEYHHGCLAALAQSLLSGERKPIRSTSTGDET